MFTTETGKIKEENLRKILHEILILIFLICISINMYKVLGYLLCLI